MEQPYPGDRVTTTPDRWRLTGLALREAGRALRAETASLLGLGGVRARTPERLVIVPPDMRTSDATIADDIYAGYFVFGGRALATGGRSPFSLEPPSQVWSDILHGFSWLRHLRAADTALARANARALVDEYLREAHMPAVKKPEVAARRVISFLSQSPLIVEGADHVFYQRFMRGLARDLRICARAVRAAPRPLVRLQCAIALAYAGLCCEGCAAMGRAATKILKRELDAQILADGGHVGRNPRVVLDLLLDLLPLKQVYLARGVDPPEALIRAIDRMPPMLRLLRHGDGTLSHFNGMGSTPVDHLTTLLFYDESRASPLQRGLISGYERLEAARLVLVADVGAPPPPFVAHEAGAGCLSFELTSGEARIVVNLGAPRDRADPIAEAARATAAHATLSLDRASSARFASDATGLARLPAAWFLRRRSAIFPGRRPPARAPHVPSAPEPLRGSRPGAHDRAWGQGLFFRPVVHRAPADGLQAGTGRGAPFRRGGPASSPCAGRAGPLAAPWGRPVPWRIPPGKPRAWQGRPPGPKKTGAGVVFLARAPPSTGERLANSCWRGPAAKGLEAPRGLGDGTALLSVGPPGPGALQERAPAKKNRRGSPSGETQTSRGRARNFWRWRFPSGAF